MAKKINKKILEYTAVFEPAEEGGYIVSVPTIPGCATQGDTLTEAKKNIKEALEACLEVLEEEKVEIPIEKRKVVTSTISLKLPVAFA